MHLQESFPLTVLQFSLRQASFWSGTIRRRAVPGFWLCDGGWQWEATHACAGSETVVMQTFPDVGSLHCPFYYFPLRLRTFSLMLTWILKLLTLVLVMNLQSGANWTRSVEAPPTPPLSFSKGRDTTGPRWTCGVSVSFSTRWSVAPCLSMARI